jgi:hypothetical protein
MLDDPIILGTGIVLVGAQIARFGVSDAWAWLRSEDARSMFQSRCWITNKVRTLFHQSSPNMHPK